MCARLDREGDETCLEGSTSTTRVSGAMMVLKTLRGKEGWKCGSQSTHRDKAFITTKLRVCADESGPFSIVYSTQRDRGKGKAHHSWVVQEKQEIGRVREQDRERKRAMEGSVRESRKE